MFRVRWEEKALNRLAEIWMEADSATRPRVNAAVEEIDRLLSIDPVACSESRDGERRVLILTPLAILFRVESDNQTVSVFRVWIIPAAH